MKKKYNIPNYVNKLARKLRKCQTSSEKILWSALRNRRLLGYKFRRQQPIGRYIVDFVCVASKLAIEIDGPVHDKTKNYDREKDNFLIGAGFKVLRIPAKKVEENIVEVIKIIIDDLNQIDNSSS